jgi:hypothetical protein
MGLAFVCRRTRGQFAGRNVGLRASLRARGASEACSDRMTGSSCLRPAMSMLRGERETAPSAGSGESRSVSPHPGPRTALRCASDRLASSAARAAGRLPALLLLDTCRPGRGSEDARAAVVPANLVARRLPLEHLLDPAPSRRPVQPRCLDDDGVSDASFHVGESSAPGRRAPGIVGGRRRRSSPCPARCESEEGHSSYPVGCEHVRGPARRPASSNSE